MESQRSSKARIARFLLKLIPIPIVVLGILERFTIPPVSLWAIGGVIFLCVVALILVHVGEASRGPALLLASCLTKPFMQ